MKKITFWGVLAFIIGSLNTYAQESVNAYFTTKEMPVLPLCPPDSTSARFKNDIERYSWGIEQRKDSVRAAIAIRDAVYGLQTIINEFSEPFGLEISKENTPAVYVLLRDALATCDSICTLPKKLWMRLRPFMVFHESSLTPWDEETLSANFSWPSGHSILGWSAALLLSEINPERADTLLARGYMYGESRVICGVHWQSDVDDARIFASAAYVKLHTSKRFLDQMRRARLEFTRLKRGNPSKAIAELEDLEHRLRLTAYNMPHGVDEVSHLKMIFVKTDEFDCEIARAVDHVVLVNDENEVQWVVTTLVRHDIEDGGFYGVIVTNGLQIGEIMISSGDAFDLLDFLFARESSTLINCSDIRFKVSTFPKLVPFSPAKQKIPRFFDCQEP